MTRQDSTAEFTIEVLMLTNFFQFNGLAACYRTDGAIVIFSPYNLAVGILDSQLDLSNHISICDRLGCFGQPSQEGPSLPDNFDLTLLITNDCNLRCKYCFADGGEKKNYMTPEMAVRIVDNVFRTTHRRNVKISFFGGEPTLNFEVIKKVVSSVQLLAQEADKVYSFYITTNGVLSQTNLDYLINHDFTFVISSDGTPTIHNFLRPGINGKPSSKYVEKTIRRLVEKQVPFKIRSTISKFNVTHMSETVRYFANLGAQTVHFEPITKAGRGKSDDINLKRATADEYLQNFILALDAARETKISVISSSYMNFLAPSHKFCDAMAGSRLVGSYNGDITCCVEVQDSCHPYSTIAIVGKVLPQTSSIHFDNAKYGKLLNTANTEQNEDCIECFAKYCCGGGCPVKNYYASGCEMADAYRCSLTKDIVKNVLTRVYKESFANNNILYDSSAVTLYRMRIPQEIWMKRKRSRISRLLAEIIVDNEITL